MLKKILATFGLILLLLNCQAQANNMEETMFYSGKIYTFLAVALLVLGGIFFFLFRLDKKVSKLEKEMNEKRG